MLNSGNTILASTVYAWDGLVAKNTSFTLPEVSNPTISIEAMGEMDFPIYNRFEDLELTIQKIGIDEGLSRLIEGGPIPLEFRWAQAEVSADGYQREVGCKAFITATRKVIPGIEVKAPDPLEMEITYSVSKYRLVYDGLDILKIDRYSGVFEINGNSQTSNIDKLL